MTKRTISIDERSGSRLLRKNKTHLKLSLNSTTNSMIIRAYLLIASVVLYMCDYIEVDPLCKI